YDPGAARSDDSYSDAGVVRGRRNSRLLRHEHGAQSLAHRQFANNLLKVWHTLCTSVAVDGVDPTKNPAERPLHAPVIHRKISLAHPEQGRGAIRQRAMSTAATCPNKAARCSPTSAQRASLPTLSATRPSAHLSVPGN